MSTTAYPCKFYCPSLYVKQDYIPSAGFRKYSRVRAMSGTKFDYTDPMALRKDRRSEMPTIDASRTQLRYETHQVNVRLRQRSTSRSRSVVSSDRRSSCQDTLIRQDRGSVCSDDPHFPLSDNKDLALARRQLRTVSTPDFEEYPPVRCGSNYYEKMTHQLINYGALRGQCNYNR